MINKFRLLFPILILFTAAAALTGCQSLYFLMGKGQQDALYKLPKGRVLVMVDPSPTTSMEPSEAQSLGDKLNVHLYRYKAADELIPQYRLMDLRKDSTRFGKMSIADVARELQADTVIYISVPQFKTESISDELTDGQAQTMVKVVDKDGKRLWPTDASEGTPVSGESTLAYSSRDQAVTGMLDLLTVRIGRMFHDYDSEDSDMTK